MNANTINSTMYSYVPGASELNKVPGFDPRRFLRNKHSEDTGKEIIDLDLKYKKLWFRLVYPNGRIKLSILKITEQIAIIEAKVFFDKNDTEPVSSFIAQRNAKKMQGSLYIQEAQYAAQDQALTDAGFGIQFSSVSGKETEAIKENSPSSATSTTVKALPPKSEEKAVTDIPPLPDTEAVSTAQTLPQPTDEIAEMSSAVLADRQEPLKDISPTPPVEPAVGETKVEPQSESKELPVSDIQEPAADVPVQTAEEEIVMEEAPSFTADMSVEDILSVMSLDMALAVVVDVGTCNGWTLAEVSERRPASLKWYLNGYPGDNNILRAGAKLLLENGFAEKNAS